MKKIFTLAMMVLMAFAALTSCNNDSTTTAEAIYLIDVYLDGNEVLMENQKINSELRTFVSSLQNKYCKEARYTWSGDSKTAATSDFTKKFLEQNKVDELKQKLDDKLAEFKQKTTEKAYGSDPYEAVIYLSVTRDGEYIYPTTGKKNRLVTYTFKYAPALDVDDSDDTEEEE